MFVGVRVCISCKHMCTCTWACLIIENVCGGGGGGGVCGRKREREREREVNKQGEEESEREEGRVMGGGIQRKEVEVKQECKGQPTGEWWKLR